MESKKSITIDIPEGFEIVYKFKKIITSEDIKLKNSTENAKIARKRYYEENKEKLNKILKVKMAEVYKNNPEYREKTIERAKERQKRIKESNNEEEKQKIRERALKYYYGKKKKNENQS